jgi:ABC-type uncharacterized transport system permease subunit
MTNQFMLLIAAGLYMTAAALLYLSIRKQRAQWRRISLGAAVVGACLHGLSQYAHWFQTGAPNFDVLSILSLCGLVIVVLLLLSAFSRNSLFDAGLVALPIGAVVLLMNAFFNSPGLVIDQASTGTTVHIMSSVVAFGVLSIAAVYAVFVALIDYFLRHHHLNALVRTLPALDILELLLFQLITAGFILLTLSLGSGLLYVSDIFAQHLVHKTVLSMLAWLVFGMLVWGRWRYGWRGRIAVRMTLAGTALLLLSYFGSKFVLEVILGRSWNS